jgi:acyl-CoA dehydrogenase
MEFYLTKDQKKLVEAARTFAEREFPEAARECDREERSPKEIWEKAGKLGFMGTFISSDYGGSGLGYLEHALVTEEFWRVDPGIGNILLAVFGAEVIGAFGTDAQKKRYLPPIGQGKAISGCAITEPNAGSDIFAMTTHAEKNGQDYVINGSKQFISNGTIADFLLVMCITNPEAEKVTRHFSFLVVETDRKGFSAEKLKGKLGIRASDTAELSFNEVKVPGENLIGAQEGKGFPQVMYLFNINRVVAAAQGVGVAQGAFEKTIDYLKKRTQFGKPLARMQGLQFKIADAAARIEAARALYHKAAWFIDQGQFDHKLISIAKLVAGEAAVNVTSEAVRLHGGYGCTDRYDVERFYRDAKVVEIYEGAKEIEKITIAREILGRDR